MAAFCMVGFAQSAPQTAKKATMMGDNAQIKDVKTGQVIRTARASKQVPSGTYGTISILRNGTQPLNTTSPANGNGNPAKSATQKGTLKTLPTLKASEIQTKQTKQTKSSGNQQSPTIKGLKKTPNGVELKRLKKQ